MPVLDVRGVPVTFPFDPYPCQVVYMERVIQSLQEGKNCLLESPTGTGKTLCLLCATLAWRQHRWPAGSEDRSAGVAPPQQATASNAAAAASSNLPAFNASVFSGAAAPAGAPKIIYSSRTHSQLSQVVGELRRSGYRVKMTTLGSRKHLCVHPTVSLESGARQQASCSALASARRCKFYNRTEELSSAVRADEPRDIEDLLRFGKESESCPYYLTKALIPVAEILFIPYQYILSREYRNALGVDFMGAVVIIDEAHNLESSACDSQSFDFGSVMIGAVVEEVDQALALLLAEPGMTRESTKVQEWCEIKAILLDIDRELDKIELPAGDQGITQPGGFIISLLERCRVNHGTAQLIITELKAMQTRMGEEVLTSASALGGKGFGARGLPKKSSLQFIDAFVDVLLRLYSDPADLHTFRTHFRLHISRDDGSLHHDPSSSSSHQASSGSAAALAGFAAAGGGPGSGARAGGPVKKLIGFWCMSPGVAMSFFREVKVHSLILTSGTLSPLASLDFELDTAFPIKLENPHVITPQQVWVGVQPHARNRVALNSSFRSRENVDFVDALGDSVLDFARSIPDGVLVFFPSYGLMDSASKRWRESGLWDRLGRCKPAFVEPKTQAQCTQVMEEYNTCISSGRGAIFFAVCRGKVSEGLDFADTSGRAVMIVGIPFANLREPKVRLKREYLDDLAKRNKGTLSGSEWYVQQAARAVNQAIGRVIRHRNDYGAILFLDERFASAESQKGLSAWVRPYTRVFESYDDAEESLRRFFASVLSQPFAQHVKHGGSRPAVDAQKAGGKRVADGGSAVLGRGAVLFGEGSRVGSGGAGGAAGGVGGGSGGSGGARLAPHQPTSGRSVPGLSAGVASAYGFGPAKASTDPPSGPPAASLGAGAGAGAVPPTKKPRLVDFLSGAKVVPGKAAPAAAAPQPAAPVTLAQSLARSSTLEHLGRPVVAKPPAAPAPEKDYITRVRATLAADEYSNLKEYMRSHIKALMLSDTGVARIAKDILSIFSADPARRSLVLGFAEFIPMAKRDLYLGAIGSLVSPGPPGPASLGGAHEHRGDSDEGQGRAGDEGSGKGEGRGPAAAGPAGAGSAAAGPAAAGPAAAVPAAAMPAAAMPAAAGPAAATSGEPTQRPGPAVAIDLGADDSEEMDPEKQLEAVAAAALAAATMAIPVKASRCPICMGTLVQETTKACKSCKAAACAPCWSKWLDLRLECPMCRARCRGKFLRSVVILPAEESED